MAKTEELTVEQAARELGVQSKTVRAAIDRNAFPNLRRAPKNKLPNIFIPKSDVETYKKTRRRRGGRSTTRASRSHTEAQSSFYLFHPLTGEPRWKSGATEWQEAAQRLARENVELRERIRKLEQK
jgi:Helix-turn-helix domain